MTDVTVFGAYRRRGIGSALLDAAERLVATRAAIVGLGVGLYTAEGDPDHGRRHFRERRSAEIPATSLKLAV